ncbi:type II toxin-antitoxin system VapC family toxin [Methylomonas sp. LL1]|uniref:type II toxin-antitoxin system VapC family toxin n=1 Tax=Methylomonas sp. LL1 TaxID=2785785 RepID=UPI0018C3CF6D|nr:type II toxin-antitoxin system VapC family toxin [Methylomonas sp. LL1]QPK62704.1 type II toxin-antitoxin system VapC family toxin [Methylomonas sp. LL1]
MDTHIWYWWINQIPGRLSSGIVDLIEQADEVAVSAISVFEMAWLVRHGRIELGGEFEQWLEDVIESDCVKFLPVTPQIASLAVAFPAYLELQGRDRP